METRGTEPFHHKLLEDWDGNSALHHPIRYISWSTTPTWYVTRSSPCHLAGNVQLKVGSNKSTLSSGENGLSRGVSHIDCCWCLQHHGQFILCREHLPCRFRISFSWSSPHFLSLRPHTKGRNPTMARHCSATYNRWSRHLPQLWLLSCTYTQIIGLVMSLKHHQSVNWGCYNGTVNAYGFKVSVI